MNAAARLLLALVLAVVAPACITPSIPIPPPEPTAMTFTLSPEPGSEQATFTYAAEPNYSGATVYIFNRRAGSGIITTANADGSVGPTAPFPARVGDNVAVTFETDEVSVSTCVVVRAGVPSPTEYCTQ